MNRLWRSIAGVFGSGGKSASQPTLDPQEERKGPQFAFVALGDNPRPDEAAIKAALAKWHEVPLGAVVTVDPDSPESGQVDSFEIDGKSIMIGTMGIPIPSDDIKYACANSFMWPEAAEALSAHTNHLIVMAMGGGDSSPAEQGIRLSRSIAAVTEAYDAIGVYWGHGCVVHKPEIFRELMEDAESDMHSLPIPLWVGFLRAPGENDAMDVYTSGLSAFGVMECEVVGSHKRPMEIINLLSGLSAYLIENGNVIQDGNTVGGDENERIVAHHADSVIGREGKVLRIAF